MSVATFAGAESFRYSSPAMQGRVTTESGAPVAGGRVLLFWSGTQETPMLSPDTLHVEETETGADGRFTVRAWAATDLRSVVRSARPRMFVYAGGREWIFVDFEKERSPQLEVRLAAFRGQEDRWIDRCKELVGQLVLVAAPLAGPPRPFELVHALEREWQHLPPDEREPPSLVAAFSPAVEEARAAYAQWLLQSGGRR